MIDFHNHILPNVDDGSKSMEMTLNMLRTASNQGIKKIINTTHLQHPKMDGKNTDYNYIQDITNKVIDKAKSNGINIDIKIASEVYYLPNLCELIDNPLATINKYMLIEFHSVIVPNNFEETFFQLKLKGITPILAHPERYRFVQEDINKLEKISEMGVLFQIDAGSLIGNFGVKTRQTSINMLSNGYCHLIGSDAHNDSRRDFCLKDAYSIIRSDQIVDTLKHNSEKLFKGKGELENVKYNLNKNFFEILKGKVLNT